MQGKYFLSLFVVIKRPRPQKHIANDFRNKTNHIVQPIRGDERNMHVVSISSVHPYNIGQ